MVGKQHVAEENLPIVIAVAGGAHTFSRFFTCRRGRATLAALLRTSCNRRAEEAEAACLPPCIRPATLCTCAFLSAATAGPLGPAPHPAAPNCQTHAARGAGCISVTPTLVEVRVMRMRWMGAASPSSAPGLPARSAGKERRQGAGRSDGHDGSQSQRWLAGERGGNKHGCRRLCEQAGLVLNQDGTAAPAGLT